MTPAADDFQGRPVRRFDNGRVWLDVLVAGGPRIVRFGRAGGESVFAVVEGNVMDTPLGQYALFGGHRVWYAPETLEPFVPDETGLTLEEIDGGVRLIGRSEPGTGLRRSMEIRFEPGAPKLSIDHTIRNEGGAAIQLAVWPITQMRVGGVAFAPQPRQIDQHAIVANRLVALWPYASWDDDRLVLTNGLLGFRATPGHNFKLGCLSSAGSVGYLRDGELFVKRFEPAVEAAHADFGCNLEMYCDPNCIELETLSPMVRLEPGAVASHVERWELHEAGAAGTDVASLNALVERFGLA